jgi:hypothetical protein
MPTYRFHPEAFWAQQDAEGCWSCMGLVSGVPFFLSDEAMKALSFKTHDITPDELIGKGNKEPSGQK